MISRIDRGKAQFALAVKGSLNSCLRLTRDLLFLRLCPPCNPERIAVHLIGTVGDIVVSVPALMALRERYPESRIVLFTSAGGLESGHAGARDLLEGAPFLDGIEYYVTEELRHTKGLLNLLRRFRRMRPDLVVSLPPCAIPFRSVLRNLLFARLTGAHFNTGSTLTNLNLFARAQARLVGLYPSEVARQIGQLRELGVESPDVRFEFGTVGEDERQFLAGVLEPHQPFVALCPGGKQMAHRWPASRFSEVAKRLRDEMNVSLVAVGSQKERELCRTVLEDAGGGLNLAGELSLKATALLLSKASLMLTNDTGPMHLAAAVGTTVVAIFGARDVAGRWYPYGEGHRVFRAELVCPRCLFAREESDHCVKKIQADEVLRACLEVLKERLPDRSTTEVKLEYAGSRT
ncbi:MAG: glycosyltransferase family 9 protein [Pyrinomonadaceae bacterium]|nr:glycosyltransferase family 9 protein [Pyrinomonadaceae bacterium]